MVLNTDSQQLSKILTAFGTLVKRKAIAVEGESSFRVDLNNRVVVRTSASGSTELAKTFFPNGGYMNDSIAIFPSGLTRLVYIPITHMMR